MPKLLLPRGYRNAELLQKKLHITPEKQLIRNGQLRAVALFHDMANRVPAYKDFLKKHKFSPSSVGSIKDFHLIPPVNKDNYLRVYPKDMLCWDGEFSHGQWVISTTSGSTGEPYYFPREASQDWQYATSAELYLRNNFKIQDKSTLYIVGFPMGAWIGGLFTYEALKIVSEQGGYNLSIITPGIHKQEIINAVKQLGRDFDQIIIGAYAPFLKDILDDGRRQGINWADYNIGFVFSAEAFTEKFRDYVFKVSKPDNPLLASLNHYGTVDLGTMAHETPESVLVRRLLVHDSKLGVIFPETRRQATFAQYDPSLFYFEEESHNLFCTAYSGLPLVRYDLKDYGGVIRRQRVHQLLGKEGINLNEELSKGDIENTTWNLPFVYVYERNDFSVSYYAFLIYPDMIRRALQSDQLQDSLTGKFTMLVDYNAQGRQELLIHIEMAHGTTTSKDLSNKVQSLTHDFLIAESSEYRETYNTIGVVVKPVIKLWGYEDTTYFRPGTKQKWVIHEQ
jgi:phenylacetate-CoA ligase